MSANYSNPVPEPGDRKAPQPTESQVGGENAFVDAHWQVDPQQQFREYTSPGRGTAPVPPFPPVSFPPGSYQPGNAGQIVGQPGYYQPGQVMEAPGYAPYAAHSGQVPGYVPYGVQPGMVTGVPGQAPVYPGYNPYGPYAGYPPYGYAWPAVPTRPKRDAYLLAIGIAAFACSCLVILGGLGSLGLIGLVNLSAMSITSTLSNGTYFASVILLLTFALAGIVGGGFCVYHSMRSLFFQRASKTIWLPRFWIFLLCYLATLGVGFWFNAQGMNANPSALTGVLIYLGGIFPALTILALGIRRLSLSKANQRSGTARQSRRASLSAQWPTSWRRLTLALVSGATLSVGLALILELVLTLIVFGGAQSNTVTQYINNPNVGNPSPSLYGLVLIVLAVIAPLVEEMVKPLAVVVLIGRVKSKAEAFALGLACGIGFNLVETTGYISSGYNDWLTVALVRSGAGLLHGFGAAMVALGWYYLTHKEEGPWQRRTLLALGCAGYAVFQHALWNGSVGLAFLPGPIGSFFQTWQWNVGPLSLDAIELVNIVEVIAILIFFVYMSGHLRTRTAAQEEARPAEGTFVAPA